jgi:hypothetical protein
MRFALLEADQEVARAAAGEWNGSVRDDSPVRLRSATALVVLKRQHCAASTSSPAAAAAAAAAGVAAAAGSRQQRIRIIRA